MLLTVLDLCNYFYEYCILIVVLCLFVFPAGTEMSSAMKTFVVLSTFLAIIGLCEACGSNGMCTIFSGCSDTEYCYRRHCRPKGDRLSSCIWGFQQDTCLSGLSCTCNSRLCDSAAITGELGGWSRRTWDTRLGKCHFQLLPLCMSFVYCKQIDKT